MINKTYIALDVETTGLNPQDDEIIELAAIKFDNGEIVDEFVTLLKPSFRIPQRITDITGITNSMVANAPTIDDVLPDFIKFCGNTDIVAHNADFDMGFINCAVGGLGLKVDNKVHCTLVLARKYLKLVNNQLATVANHFGLADKEFHRAKADAMACGEIYWYLANENYLQDNSLKDPSDLAISVTDLNKYIKNLLEGDFELGNITVSGEISNFKPNFSGHLYMSLKDDKSAIKAVMWKSNVAKLKFKPEDGMKVVARGRISLYEPSGQYQIVIDTLAAEGVGDLYVAYEQLKKKLELEGYFDAAKKKPLIKFPKKIGVVTSPTGAVIKDIINVATRRYKACEIILYPSKVQGKGGELDVAAGIEYFNTRDDIDTLIVGRGGGSIEDLWNFNEEIVARAIYNSKIPIISAVGHETDFTIADFVADVRAATPSQAAEFAVPSAEEIRNYLGEKYRRMLQALKSKIENYRQLLQKFEVKGPKNAIETYRMRIDNLVEKLEYLANKSFNNKKNQMAILSGKLNALSPLEVLHRGYAIAEIKGKKISEAEKGDKLITKLDKITIESVVEKVG